MTTVVVPFRSSDPKRRLATLSERGRLRLAEAMLADVLAAAVAVGPVLVVSPQVIALPEGATHVEDPRRGQGAAVRAALDAATAAGLPAPYLAGRAHARGADRASTRDRCVKVAVLSGGVGGARFLRGLLGVVDPGNVSIVGNIADDIEVLGLRVSPDLDSILYTLTGLSDDERGWGVAGETWTVMWPL